MEKPGKYFERVNHADSSLEKRVEDMEGALSRRDLLLGVLSVAPLAQSVERLVSINQSNVEGSTVERLKVFQERFDLFLKKLAMVVKTKNNESVKEKLAIVYEDYKNFYKEYRIFDRESLTSLAGGRLKASTFEKVSSLMQDIYNLRVVLGKYFGDFKEVGGNVEEVTI